MKEIIEKYKKHLQENGLTDELFKWEILAKYKGRPSIDADKFIEEFKSIDFRNLLFYNVVKTILIKVVRTSMTLLRREQPLIIKMAFSLSVIFWVVKNRLLVANMPYKLLCKKRRCSKP